MGGITNKLITLKTVLFIPVLYKTMRSTKANSKNTLRINNIILRFSCTPSNIFISFTAKITSGTIKKIIMQLQLIKRNNQLKTGIQPVLESYLIPFKNIPIQKT